MTNALRVVVICVLLLLVFTIQGLAKKKTNHHDAAPAQPNIVILLADDTGWGDLSCYGHPSIVTPNLDQMAREGLRFTRFYSAAPVCTPSRSSLLTGRLQVRNGCYSNSTLLDGVFDPASTGGLPTSEITIAKALKSKGYATTAIGKWHLGNLPQFRAVAHGFDSYLGIPYSHDMCPCYNEAVPSDHCTDQWPGCPIYENNTIIQQPADMFTINERYTNWALSFMERNHRDNMPFFLYFAYHHSHHPVFSAQRFHDTSRRGYYGDSMNEMDWSVGQVLAKLKALNADSNTLVFFTSDNGPDLPRGVNGGTASLLTCGKGTVWEGGIREPAIAWWPGKITAGRTTLEIGSTMDLFTTSLKLAGVALPRDRFIDGKDLSPILFENKPSLTQFLFHYQGTTEVFAVTMGAYKAHYIHAGWLGTCGPPTPEKYDPPLLFQIEHDPSELFPIPANTTEYKTVMKKIDAGLAEHLKSIVYYQPPQFDLKDNPNVEPCCNKQTKCVCGQGADDMTVLNSFEL